MMEQHPLADALRKARDTFTHYSDLHKAKGTREGDQKAAYNFALAVEMNEALAQYEKSDTDRDQLRDALAAAYSQGATDVHKVWSSESDPDFGEAASDYASHAITALASKTAIDPATVERDKLIEALTPSGDTKAAYLGEFKFNVEIENVDFEEDEDESDHNPRTHMMPVYVPWTTIKDIMKAIRVRALGKDQA